MKKRASIKETRLDWKINLDFGIEARFTKFRNRGSIYKIPKSRLDLQNSEIEARP